MTPHQKKLLLTLSVAGSAGAALVGGIAIGQAGAVGSLYEGYTLSGGDDFASLDVLRPNNSRGKFWPTRTYFAGARGSDTGLAPQYDGDPSHTGFSDFNRGVPKGYNTMQVASSILTLQARLAAAGERTGFQGTGRYALTSMIDTIGALAFNPGAQGTGDVIIEARLKFSAGGTNGWHPAFWLISAEPVITADSDEHDFEIKSGTNNSAVIASHNWTAGADSATTNATAFTFDNAFHTWSWVLSTDASTGIRLYKDGVLFATNARSANIKSKALRALISSHVDTNGTEAGWDSTGQTISVDWLRAWRRSAQPHYKPLALVADQNIASGGSVVITLPSLAALWGAGVSSDYVQAVPFEENEPGGSHTVEYSQFPAGVTYDSVARQLTVAPSDLKAGRLHFVVHPHAAGSTSEPLRFAVNVGPRLTFSTLSFTAGQVVSYDLYAACDCGVLTTNGAAKAKSIAVTGLAGSGLSYSDTTGLLTGTFVSGTYSIGVTITNSIGQTVTQAATVATQVVDPGYAYESWTGPGWFDASDGTSVVLSGSNVASLANKRAGVGNLTAAGAAITYPAAVQNSKPALRFPRSTGTPARLEDASSLLSTMAQGSNGPYTVIAVYTPTDTNTGFIWSWSDTVDATNSQEIALVRRSATAPSVRRQLVTATANDVTWGAGQAANSPRIVAVKFPGTTVSVWDTSLTKAVSGVAQSVAAFNTELQFRIGSAETAGASDPTISGTCCAMDLFEVVIENTARTDAEVQQAITDLATKWGITLT